MKVLFLVNPHAGGRANQQAIDIAMSEFRKADWDVTKTLTTSEKQANDLIRGATYDGYNMVAVAGGDGTVHNAIQNIPLATDDHPEPIPLAIFPLGSGNDFIRGTGALPDPESSAKNIVEGVSAPFDMGLVEPVDQDGNPRDGRIVRFCNTAGVGIDSQTLATRLTAPKWLGTRYDLLFVLTLMKLFPLNIVMEAEDWTFEGPVYWAVCCNNHQIGNGMKIAPGATIDDGVMDIVFVHKDSKLKFIMSLPKVFKGAHLDVDCFEMRKAKSVVLRCSPEQNVAADGDITELAPSRIRLLNKAARLRTSWLNGKKLV
ncbi:MAG TPA: YegS/Rv2252/BmrU family lipid kinase [bacterium]